VFFSQVRVGLRGKKFFMYKFRSMCVDAEKKRKELLHLNEMSGPVFKLKHDPRVTRVGRFIRRTSLDELPQLWNVLKGDMSLVGPRPNLPHEVDQYDYAHRRRLSVKPGLTCLWQISGRNNIDFDRWMDLDIAYIENWSYLNDLKIIVKTIPAVFKKTGAS
jgi:lipopolysaccharide/colanic/teichoic acid biosynthesis glycosyltransferase